MTISSSNFKPVYEDLGIEIGRLGCIMADTAPIKVSDVILTADLFEREEDPDYVKGYVSEQKPHVTLLFGLMRSGHELHKHVDAVLEGWELKTVEIEKVDFFYSNDPEVPLVTLIAAIKPTEALIEGNGRLRMLPHIDTFMDYKPHITLAYVKDTSDWQGYVDKLNERLAGTTVDVVGLNYGD